MGLAHVLIGDIMGGDRWRKCSYRGHPMIDAGTANACWGEKTMVILLVILRVVLGLLFGAAAVSKLVSAPMMVQEFGTIGFGQWFRYFTALTELAGVILLIRPRTVTIGSSVLCCICIGAFLTQLFMLHGDVFHTIVLGAVAAFVAWSYRLALSTR